MSDEHFYPARWAAPRGPWTWGIRVAVYIVVAAVAVIVVFSLGASHDGITSSGCDSAQYECSDELGIFVAIEWAVVAFLVVAGVAALNETVLAIRRRKLR